MLSDYYFSMIFDTDIPSTGVVEIIFPENQYLTGITPTKYPIMAPYPTIVDTAIIQSYKVIIPLNKWPKNTPITIAI